MRIYKIHNNTIHSLKVRETENYYVTKKAVLVFGCKKVIKKEECSTSIKEAFIKEIENLIDLKYTLIQKLHEITSNLQVLKQKLEEIIINDRF